METTSVPSNGVEDEEEYVLIDLDSISGPIHIPPNAPYVLSGLDTLNPIMIIDDKIKLVGEYEETIGTCIVFDENDATPVVHEETGPSEENLFSGTCIVDPNQTPIKQVKPIASLHKILRFRLLSEGDTEDETAYQGTTQVKVNESLTSSSQPNMETSSSQPNMETSSSHPNMEA